MKKLVTPFGNLEVTLNNVPIEYTYLVKKTEENGITVDVFSININLLNCKINDEIRCYISDKKLRYNDGDERVDLLSIENDDFILGVSGYEPQYHDKEKEFHCYELDECKQYFLYKIYRDPQNYANEFKRSYTIELQVCWLNKNEFKDHDTSLFMILC